jgi:hypothetical protein
VLEGAIVVGRALPGRAAVGRGSERDCIALRRPQPPSTGAADLHRKLALPADAAGAEQGDALHALGPSRSVVEREPASERHADH